nr:S4 domain-containing protein YaaA [Evansella caseinilytica]
MKQKITINDEYITLGQLLKEVGVIQTGGAAKWYLMENSVQVNQEDENRRGRKLYPGDQITIDHFGKVIIEK